MSEKISLDSSVYPFEQMFIVGCFCCISEHIDVNDIKDFLFSVFI